MAIFRNLCACPVAPGDGTGGVKTLIFLNLVKTISFPDGHYLKSIDKDTVVLIPSLFNSLERRMLILLRQLNTSILSFRRKPESRRVLDAGSSPA